MRLFAHILSLFDAGGRRRILGLLFLILGGAVLEAVGIGLIMPFIALISDPAYLDNQKALKWLYQASSLTTAVQFYVACALGLLLLFLVKNAYLAVTTVVQYRFIYAEMVTLSQRLFGAYLRGSYAFHIQHNSALLIRNIGNEVPMFFANVLTPGFILVTEGVVVLAIVAVLLWVSPGPTVLAVLFFGSVTGLFYRVVRRNVRRYGVAQQTHNGERIKWINQGLGGIKEIKVLGREDYFINAFSHHNAAFAEASRYAMILNQMPRLFIETIAVAAMLLGVVAVLAAGGDAQRLLPTIALFAMASFRLLPSINRIISSVARIAHYLPAVDVVCRDVMLALPLPSGVRSAQAENSLVFRDRIDFSNIGYTYPGAERSSLRGVSLSIPRGSSVALVGPSGSGKTTVADILLGLLTPEQGQVLVDGRDIRENLTAWQRHLGYIPQTIYLTDDSVRHNVAFGVPDVDIDDQAVWAALCLAHLDDHVRSLPQGLDTVVGERGVKFSGGQRQRIGIARALYHDPEVLVLDEATSALDADTERSITEAIDQLAGAKTLIIIAHRPSTIEKCGIRFELRDGKFVP